MGNANQDSNAASALIKSRAFDAAFTANSIANPDGIITEANVTFLRIWGYATREDVVGKPIAHFFKDPNDLSGIMVALDAMGYWEGAFVAKRNGGSPFMAHGSATVVRDETGRMLGYQSAVLDITEVRQAEETLRKSEMQYRTLFEGAVEGILIANAQTRGFLYANPAMCRMLGYTEQELLSFGVADIHPQESVEQVLADFEKLIDGGKTIVEAPCLRKDGSVIDVSITATYLVLDGCGMLFGFFSDVSARKQTERALLASEEKYRKLHESMMDAFVSVDMTGRIIECNRVYQEMLGYTQEELRGLTYVDITPEDWHAYEAGVVAEQILPRGYSDLYEKQYRRKDGSVLPVELRTFLVGDAAGRPVSMWAIVRDISERKRTENALRTSEEKYREVIELAVDGIMLGAPDGVITGANVQMQKMTGRPLEQLLGRHIRELFAPEELDTNPLRFDLLDDGEVLVNERDMRCADGTSLPVEMHSKRMPDGSYQSIIRDVTERKQAEQALRESHELLALFMRHSPIYSFIKAVTPTESRVLYASENYQQMTGIAGSEMVGKTMADLFPAEFAAKITADDYAVVAAREILSLEEDFEGRNYTTLKFPITQGHRTLLAGYTIDITERKQAEQNLREWNITLEQRVAERTLELNQSERRFRALAEASFEGIAISEGGILMDGNSRFAMLHGYALAEMIGRPVTDFIAPESRPLVSANIGTQGEDLYEFMALCKDGSVFPAEVYGRMEDWMGRSMRISTIRDLTESKQAATNLQALQTELEHVQRLALVSEVNAGIVHQISQPLSAMAANIASVTTRLEVCKHQRCEVQGCDSLGIIKDINADIARMRNIVIQLRTLVDPEQPLLEEIDFNHTLANVLPLLRQKAATARVRLAVELGQDLPPVHANAVQLGQVIYNLVHNACEACSNVPPERRVVVLTTRALAGEGVELCVRDAGTGIPPAVLIRLFTPFFSTKAGGFGIGLRISQTIVQAHGGSISGFNNANGLGATFRVVLPLHPPNKRRLVMGRDFR